MEIKCDYCGSMIEETLPECPNCGAPNDHMARSAKKIPQTIAELQAFCKAKKLNLEKLHFHIGENYKAPKAFGIYRDGDGDYVVYKNKADGSRAVRYKGKDEAYAVNEIYQKLKAEVLEVKEKSAARPTPVRTAYTPKPKKKRGCLQWFVIILAVLIILAIIGSFLPNSGPTTGYYTYGGNTYYHNSNGWYQNSGDDWVYDDDVDDDLDEHYSDYFDDSYSGSTFSGSSYDYDTGNNWDDDWDDDDWSWDWGSDDDDDDWDWGSDDDWDDWDDDWGDDWDWDDDW